MRTNSGYGMAALIYNNLLNLISGTVRPDSHHSSSHAPLTLHSRHGQILVHSHCSLRSRSALASVTPVSLVKKDVRLLCVRFGSYCNCFIRQRRAVTGPWSMFTPAVTLRSRSAHAPLTLRSRSAHAPITLCSKYLSIGS